MTIDQLKGRKGELQNSLNNTQQSFHVLLGHINEIDYQIQKLEQVTQASESDLLANSEEAHVE